MAEGNEREEGGERRDEKGRDTRRETQGRGDNERKDCEKRG